MAYSVDRNRTDAIADSIIEYHYSGWGQSVLEYLELKASSTLGRNDSDMKGPHRASGGGGFTIGSAQKTYI